MSKVILMEKFRAKKEEEKHVKEYFYSEDGRILRTETDEIIEIFDEKERLREVKIVNIGISTRYFYNEDTDKLSATQDYRRGEPIEDTLVKYRYLDNADIIDYSNNNKEIITYDRLKRKKTLIRNNGFVDWKFKYEYLGDTNEEIKVEQIIDGELVSVTEYTVKEIDDGIIKINNSNGEILVKKYDLNNNLVYKESEFSIVEYVYEDSKLKKEIIWFKNDKFDELL